MDFSEPDAPPTAFDAVVMNDHIAEATHYCVITVTPRSDDLEGIAGSRVILHAVPAHILASLIAALYTGVQAEHPDAPFKAVTEHVTTEVLHALMHGIDMAVASQRGDAEAETP
ncbi:hypothetical protein SAMN00768000_0222 [Sulfobacillus thermosulfidooxidans DSM 9293]|uniref:Uncharacterized protein n=1 Tax=Sulfobacillus thermosulfidooxidans (strain DSM 9293 / VKM B-1269 / AT-1) TaxID=929705 RepID=A0A1W1W8D2_SULTA|nr:hypothetical protein [Sulfobacillus thermosulfidooxidans]SMC02013.1 hypothetical protein SAMN00768000_0222 [Sulfobacillus thermosulfidooxidans DSM 9293]